MLFTATTVKDSPGNVRFFVDANLASGVDHMFVFLDSPQAEGQREIGAFLDDHPHVTCVRTRRKDWWLGNRPHGLNVRQRINVNWVRSVLEPFAWAEWLFHIDGDEVALLDRDELARVPEGCDAVWLPPLEAVSELSPAGRPTRFKRLLPHADLNLLHVLGAIDAPSNQAYFHGHVMGKSGIRPGSGLALTLHDAISSDGVRKQRHEADGLRLLHYDAVSGEEFIRKWSTLARAGHTRYRKSRAPVARALRALAHLDVPDETREKYLRRVYELTTRDDVALLADLRLLEEVDPGRGGSVPRDLPEGAAAELAARVEELRHEPKRQFYVADAASSPVAGRSPRRGVRSGARRIRQLVR
jgi:hypothetical protein